MISHLALPFRVVFENILVDENFIHENIHRTGHRVTVSFKFQAWLKKWYEVSSVFLTVTAYVQSSIQPGPHHFPESCELVHFDSNQKTYSRKKWRQQEELEDLFAFIVLSNYVSVRERK